MAGTWGSWGTNFLEDFTKWFIFIPPPKNRIPVFANLLKKKTYHPRFFFGKTQKKLFKINIFFKKKPSPCRTLWPGWLDHQGSVSHFTQSLLHFVSFRLTFVLPRGVFQAINMVSSALCNHLPFCSLLILPRSSSQTFGVNLCRLGP